MIFDRTGQFTSTFKRIRTFKRPIRFRVILHIVQCLGRSNSNVPSRTARPWEQTVPINVKKHSAGLTDPLNGRQQKTLPNFGHLPVWLPPPY